jgi:hypothetical protein
MRAILMAALVAASAGTMAGPAAISALNTAAWAQTTPPGTPAPRTTVNLTAEHRHIIKEIIIKEMKVQPAASAEVPTTVGEVVPQGVPLQPIPVEVSAKIPALKAHSFIVKDGVVLIVDPKDNRIAEKVE